MVDREHVGTIKIHSSGTRFKFVSNFVLQDNFSPPQSDEILGAVADKIRLMELTRRILK
jgi:hypothetical protein